MAYTLKERFANKNEIKNMSLYEIYTKYGYKDLFKDELNSRLSTNIEEVRDFYKNHNPNGYTGNYSGELKRLSEMLKLSPVELLTWDSFNPISNEVANEFLTNDYSWLDNEAIVNKVSKEFLYESLLKTDIYKYSNLLEKLSFNQIEQILLSDKVQYDKLPNINILINSINLGENDYIIIINNALSQKNFDIINYLLNINKLSNSSIENILINIKDNLFFEEFLMFIESCPNVVINVINANNGYFFQKLITGYENKIEDILNSSLFTKLNEDNIHFLVNQLDQKKMFELIVNNNDLYNKVKNSINYYSFLEYFESNTYSFLPMIFKSDFLQNFISVDRLEITNSGKWDNLSYKIYDYIFSNKDMLKTYFEKNFYIQNISIIGFFKKNELIKEQQENIADYILDVFNDSRFNNNVDFLFYLFEKYPYFKEKIVNSSILDDIILYQFDEIKENYIPNQYSNLMKILDKYPDKTSIINIDELLTKCSAPKLLLLFERYPIVENAFIHKTDLVKKIMESNDRILEFMPFLEKHNITNDNIKKMQESFNEIAEVRPELSWGNSSLNTTILSDDFIRILGTRYIDAILSYNSEASNIVKELYEQGKLAKLKEWLDYLTLNISNNDRMIHFYIMTFNKMESLVDDILQSKIELNSYQKQLLEEIIEQDNIYDIKNVNELNSYLQVKAQKIFENKKNLDSNDVQELFLNTSSLKKGVPWRVEFNFAFINMDYIKYKYVDTGIISEYEYSYLLKVKNIIDNKCDIGLIQELLNEYDGKAIPTARIFKYKERKEVLTELNSKLIDLDEVRKIASYDDPNAEVYIEIKDGIEYIHLNGYDYKCLSCGISKRLTSRPNEKQKSTFSYKFEYDFEQYRIFSEKIKKEKSKENLEDLGIGELIQENPKNWFLMEGVSTISTGIASSRSTAYDSDVDNLNYGWGKNSNVSIIGGNTYDYHASHNPRDLTPNDTATHLWLNEVLYQNNRGEIFFDRKDNDNQNIAPEFIYGGFVVNDSQIKAAKYYHCPIILKGPQYTNEYEQRLDLNARKKFLESLDVSVIDDIIYNNQNRDMAEKVDFLINSLNSSLQENRIDISTYIKRLTDLKWYLYERSFENEYRKINEILNQITEQEIYIEESNISRGSINFTLLISVIILTIIFGIIIAISIMNI